MIKIILKELPKLGFTNIRTNSEEQNQSEQITGHMPDVTFNKNDGQRTFVILAVETCSAIAQEETGHRWGAFYEEARRISGEFHLAVPKFCNGDSGRALANQKLEELHIKADAIWVVNGSLRYIATRGKT